MKTPDTRPPQKPEVRAWGRNAKIIAAQVVRRINAITESEQREIDARWDAEWDARHGGTR